MKRYVELQCSICKRKIDSLIDTRHYAPDKCTITLQCEGRLAPVGFTNDNQRNSVAPIGVTNWYPRGSVITDTTVLQPDALYNTSTGSKQQLVLAVSLSSPPSDDSVVTLNLVTEEQTVRDFLQYTYRKTSAFQIINGVEDGQAKKVLRYSVTAIPPDHVEVYLNGIKLNNGTGPDDFQTYANSSSPAPPNSVYFNTAITSNAQVDVIVTKAAQVGKAQLVFNRTIDDESRLTLGAWEGVSNVITEPGSGKWYLFYHDVSEGNLLPLNIKLRLDPDVPSVIGLGLNSTNITLASILLSREELFTSLDRQRSNWVPITNLDSDTGYLIVKLIKSVRTLYVTETAVSSVFPPLKVTRFHAPVLITSGILGNSDAAELDNTLIVGPDT